MVVCTGLTYPGPAFIRVEYRWLERVNNSLIPDQWSTLKTMTTDADYNVTGHTRHTLQSSNQSFEQDSVDSVQLRIVQPEHGGGLCNCWEISKLLITFDGNSYFDLLNETRSCYTNTSRQLTRNDTGPVQFCDGSAGEPRGVVFLPITLDNGQTEGCEMIVNGSALVDKQPPPMNCETSNPRIELSYVLDLAPDGCDKIDVINEGIEVSLGNWDRDGDWIPLAYHTRLSTNDPPLQVRDYDVPYYNCSGVHSFKISVCGDDYLRDGLQIRWLQQVNLVPNTLRDVVTLDNVSISLIVNETSISLLKDGFDQGNLSSTNWNKEIRNSGVSTDCSGGSDDHKIVFGLNCTTFGCELNRTDASRIATTVPLNITQFLEKFNGISTNNSSAENASNYSVPVQGNQSNATVFNICYPELNINPTSVTPMDVTPMDRTAPPTSSIDSSLAEELESAILIVLKIINEKEELRAIKQKSPAEAATSLLGLLKDPQVDRRALIYLLSDIVDRAKSINDSQQFGQDVLEVGDELLKQALNTSQSSTIVGSTLLATIEQLAFNVLAPNEDGLRTSNIELIVQEVEQDGNEDSYFTGIETTNGSIRVPTELVRMMGNGTGPVTAASVYYRNMSGLLPTGENDTVLASPVVSTSLQCGDKICDTANIQLSQPVIVTLKHFSQLAQDSSEMKCVFWDFKRGSDSRLVNGRWNTTGCERNDSLSNSTHTVCECTHLTNFAILLSSQPIVEGVHGFALEVIGYIGVSLSVLAMLATIVALVYLRSLWSMRNYIHINLCVSLILAQLMFVSGVTPHGGGGVVDPGCRTAAVLMHYLFLVSFMWMLMEGVVLYVALVKVFVKNQKRYIIGFTIFSYGAPLLYMGLCVPLGFTLYPEADYGYGYVQVSNSTQDNETTTQQTAVCWLNPHGYFIQTFIVPVVLVILANFGFFIMALVIMKRHAKKETHKNRIQRARYWLKSSVSLVTIMGLTWIIGLLVFEVPALFTLAYIFTIFVAFQGVAIFVIFVPLSKQVRDAYSKWWRVKVAESNILRNFSDWSFRSKSQSVVISNGKTPSTNQRSSSNIYELESSKSLFESKASVSLDTEESEAPDYGFTFNITMIFPQGKSDRDV
ncbi:adhesion G-protein coupled receptor G2-like isoform X2 [Halichondria panicea]|uniref:adhesion G-protein coupled receptor G2-like isoform X2 n=1 Tax=Halichondria panicea TaxID=6063 RepID=UPI00312B6C61